MSLYIVTAHAGADSLYDAIESWGDPSDTIVACGSSGMLKAYQDGYKAENWPEYSATPIIAFFHDDLIIKEPWVDRILKEFEDPKVGLVGFGGALVHGSPDIYKVPYNHKQLGRSFYRSNVDDAEVHGERFTGSCDVAVLDGFALIVRRSILDRAGGWPVNFLDYVGYDYWLCAEAHRQGYRIRLVGVRCHHLGGRTAVALKLKDNAGEEYDKAHRYIYDEFRDVLPWSCL